MDSDSSSPPAPPRRGLNMRLVLSLVVIVVIAGGIAVLAEGGQNNQGLLGNAHGVHSASFAGQEVSPRSEAPPLQLRNYLGQTINIDQYRGKALLVTFLYTNCPDVCPLIASDLRVAQNMMGPAVSAKAQILAVSVDPRGDTPKAVAAFLARHGMTGRMQYLIGSRGELARVWKAWSVGSEQDAQQPQFVNHTGIVYGISASGKVSTVYFASFKPSEIAHDVPLLAAE